MQQVGKWMAQRQKFLNNHSTLVCEQVASRELHIPMSKVYIGETSTNAVPNTFISAASFGTDANGMAVKVCDLFLLLPPLILKH